MKLTNLLRQFVNAAVEMFDAITIVFGMLAVFRVFAAFSWRFAAFSWRFAVKLASQMLLDFASLVPNRLSLIRKPCRMKMLGSLVEQPKGHVKVFGAFAARRFVTFGLTLTFPSFCVADEFFQPGLHSLSFVLLASAAKLVSLARVLLNLFVQPALVELSLDFVFDARCFVRVAAFPQLGGFSPHCSDVSFKLLVLGTCTLLSVAFPLVLRASLTFTTFVFPPLAGVLSLPIFLALAFPLNSFLTSRLAAYLGLTFWLLLSCRRQKTPTHGGKHSNGHKNSTT